MYIGRKSKLKIKDKEGFLLGSKIDSLVHTLQLCFCLDKIERKNFQIIIQIYPEETKKFCSKMY